MKRETRNRRDLIKQILKGDVRALAPLMTLIEGRDPKVKPILKAIYPHTGRSHVIGVTGAAGTGKSSLIDRMTAEYRRRKKNVGVLAVDPTSFFSNGAVLGDRIRMREHFLDDGVFIRSFATRGKSGGVCAAVRDAIHLLDAGGKEVIFVETIGVGQDELEIAGLADVVLVVLIPEMGDEVQDMKAGLSEIADILVVNKADRPGAAQTVEKLKFAFEDRVVVATSALTKEGIQLLVDTLNEHRHKNLGNGAHRSKRLDLCRQEVISLLRERVVAELQKKIGHEALEKQVKRIAERRLDPYSVAETMAKKMARS